MDGEVMACIAFPILLIDSDMSEEKTILLKGSTQGAFNIMKI